MDSDVRNVKTSKGFYLRIEGIRRKFHLSLYKILWCMRDILAKAIYFVGIWTSRGEEEMWKAIKGWA